jgi:hypothetical protein
MTWRPPRNVSRPVRPQAWSDIEKRLEQVDSGPVRSRSGPVRARGPRAYCLGEQPESIAEMDVGVRRCAELEVRLVGVEGSAELIVGVEAIIDVSSIDTGVADRDGHLRSPDFFDAERFPNIIFRFKRIEGSPPKQEGDRFRLVGDLTIRDSALEVVLDCEYEGRGTDPWDKLRAGFNFRTELDRQEWGLRWNQALETGGVLVANKVRVEGELQFVRQGE